MSEQLPTEAEIIFKIISDPVSAHQVMRDQDAEIDRLNGWITAMSAEHPAMVRHALAGDPAPTPPQQPPHAAQTHRMGDDGPERCAGVRDAPAMSDLPTPDPQVAALVRASGHTVTDSMLILSELNGIGWTIVPITGFLADWRADPLEHTPIVRGYQPTNRERAMEPRGKAFWCGKCDGARVQAGTPCTRCGGRSGKPRAKKPGPAQ